MATQAVLNDEVSRLLKAEAQDLKLSRLDGQRIVLTGTMSLHRNDMTRVIRALGGDVLSAVTGRCTLLVAANPSSRSQKVLDAQKYGVKVISEEGFAQLIAPPA